MWTAVQYVWNLCIHQNLSGIGLLWISVTHGRIDFIGELGGEAALVPVVQVDEHEEDEESGADDAIHAENHHRALIEI